MAHAMEIPVESGNDVPGDRPRIRIPKTAEVIAGQIRARIVKGELSEGDFLPSEAHLMDALSVSRPTLREAFRILEAERLISIGRGSRTGARVHIPNEDGVARYAGFALQAGRTTVADIYEARIAIEPYAARLVAERNSEAGALRLVAEIKPLSKLVDAGAYTDFMLAVKRFHIALGEMSGNKSLLLMVSVLQNIVVPYQVEYIRNQSSPPERQRQISLAGVKSFNRLIDFIRARDGDRAESHWRIHTINANREWLLGCPPDAVIDLV